MSLIFRTNNPSGNALPATFSYFNYFSPTQISGCCLWLDSQDNTKFTFSSGSNIATWLDKSGVGNTATGVNSPVLTANLINGKQAVATANSPYFTGPLSITGATATTFAVAVTTASLPLSGLDQRLVTFANTTNVDYGRTDGAIALFNQSGSSRITTWRVAGNIGTSDITTNVPFIACSKYDGTNGFLWKNGSPGSIASSASSGNFNVTKYGIGNQANPTSEFWRGYIGEIIVYNTSLSDTDRRLVEGYLAQKWGLTASLIAGHPGLTQSLPFGKPGTLPATFTNLFTPITSVVLNTIATYLRNYMSEFRNPSFFGYKLDGNSYFITDGGNDMYDNGNYTYPWFLNGGQFTGATGGIQAFSINYANTTATTVDEDFVYVSLGYTQSSVIEILSIHPLTVLGFRTSTGTPVGFQLAGNSGADGGGTLASGILYAGDIIQGFTVHAFYRETYAATDPSHCNLFILLGHSRWGSVFGTISSFADPVANGGNGCYFFTSGAGVSNILAIQTLLSKASGVLVTAAECQTVVQAFVNRVKLAVGF